MWVDLVQTTTRDGVRLDGVFQVPPASRKPALGIDAVALVHGTGGNFYSSTLFDTLAERFLELGCGVLRLNMRGHDGISTAVTSRGGRRLGAAYEIVADCRHDLAAWIDWLKERAGPRLGLLGHSLGGVKCLYALAHEPALTPTCLIAVSPPRLSYSVFCSGLPGAAFLETYRQAEHLVATGQPAALLEVSLPLPFIVTAAGYVEKYGPDERYNFLNFAAGLTCPTLFTFGSVEVENNMAFHGVPEALEPIVRKWPRWKIETILGADHFYAGKRAELAGCIEAWL